MKLASIFWTIFISIGIFFAVVYFGIKDNQTSRSKQLASQQATRQKDTTGTLNLPQADAGSNWRNRSNHHSSTEFDTEFWAGSERRPILLEEEPSQTIASLDSPPASAADWQSGADSPRHSARQLERHCSQYLIAIGIVNEQFDQAMSDCITQNTAISSNFSPSYEQSEDALLRSQCESAIDQRELLTEEEIVMLVSQCVETLRE